MATPVYLARLHRVYLETGPPVTALTFVIDRGHPQYGGRLGVAEAAAIVRAARGESGPNPEYVYDAADHLAALGIHDPHLAAIAATLRAAGVAPDGSVRGVSRPLRTRRVRRAPGR